MMRPEAEHGTGEGSGQPVALDAARLRGERGWSEIC